MKRLRPLLVYVHLPKAGGTSFRHALARFQPHRHLELYVNNTDFTYSPDALARILEGRPEIVSISSHFIRVFPPAIGDRQCYYVTILRNPRTQFMSYVKYVKKHYRNLRDETLRGYLPPNTPDVSARDFADWVTGQAGHIPFSDNYATGYFSWYPWVLANRGECDMTRCRPPTCSPEERLRYRECRLELAKTVLERFFFVGILEQLEGAMPGFRRKCKEAGLPVVPATHLLRENTTDDMREDFSWLHASDEVGRKVLASQAEDTALYEWALERAASGR